MCGRFTLTEDNRDRVAEQLGVPNDGRRARRACEPALVFYPISARRSLRNALAHSSPAFTLVYSHTRPNMTRMQRIVRMQCFQAGRNIQLQSSDAALITVAMGGSQGAT